MKKQGLLIPPEVMTVTETLEKAGFEAYVVGGCVRDSLLGLRPKDWDVTTDAMPEKIQELFPETYYNNAFGTVGVVFANPSHETLKVVEVTPYRTEGRYTDARRPDSVAFSRSLEEDLKRRDFTINAIAYNIAGDKLVDLYGGAEDLRDRIVRAVGKAEERFAEDALRILRAIRISTELDFAIDGETKSAVKKTAQQLGKISKERIRDEFVRIINSDRPMGGLALAHDLGVLSHIAPDLERGIGVTQNQAHRFDVWEHNLRTLQHAANKGWSFDIRLASLFHDISKPETRRWSDEKKDWTFYGHDVVGGRLVKKILGDLRFPRETIEKTVKLVRWHMFFSDPDKITLSAVRRVIANVGKENIWDLMHLRVCDRIGTGRPKEQPFRLRKYQSMVEEALRDPISVGMLAVNGSDVMQITGEGPGPRLGWILHALLEEVLDDPKLNDKDTLTGRVRTLAKLLDSELKAVGESGKQKKEGAEEAEVAKIRSKYWVS